MFTGVIALGVSVTVNDSLWWGGFVAALSILCLGASLRIHWQDAHRDDEDAEQRLS